MYIQKVSLANGVPNIPPRQSYDDKLFNAIREDNLADVTDNQIVTKSGIFSNTTNYDSEGRLLTSIINDSSDNKSTVLMYHDKDSIFPTMKVVRVGDNVQAVKIDPETQKPLKIFTRQGSHQDTVINSKDGTKEITSARQDLNGKWNYDRPECLDASKKIDMWV